MIPTVRDDNVPLLGNCHPLGSVERARQRVDEGEKRTRGVEDLESGVSPVSHHDVVLLVHGYAGRRVELAVSLAVGAKTEQETTGAVEDLQTEKECNLKRVRTANGYHFYPDTSKRKYPSILVRPKPRTN